MGRPVSKLRRIRESAQALWDDSALRSHERLSRLHRFVHFWMMVGRSFSRNRCPVRASALAYATLLALIPMLAVAVSITSSFLKKEGEDRIDQFIVKLVATLTPPAAVNAGTNSPARPEPTTLDVGAAGPAESGTNPTAAQPMVPSAQGAAQANPTNLTLSANTNEKPGEGGSALLAQDEKAVAARKAIARTIHDFIQNTRSGALGLTGSVLLIFAAISMLSRIEETFNDIWGVARGRSRFMRIVLYWGVLSLAPMLVVVAVGLASGPHLESTKNLLERMPFLSSLFFQFLPVVLLCLTFSLFYILIPNTHVDWRAALVGGLVGGLLFHLNSLVSVLYVSRVVSNSKIYGSLGLVPVFMIGLYFSWVILLFGAQVAYGFQNRVSYREEKQVENIDQRGREFIALRLMTCVGQRFARGEPPPTVLEISEHLCVPTRLVRQVMQTLVAARLVVETAGADPAYFPARPLENITCHDVLLAMRTSQGQELATGDEPARAEVYGEFERIQEAERRAAESVTMLALVNRTATKRLDGP